MKAIYKITNNINGKIYIGQSVDPYRRFTGHKSRANHNSNQLIHQAMREFGCENFQMDILEWTEVPDEREQFYIQEFNSLNPNGYNELEGGIYNLPHSYGEDHHNSCWSKSTIDHVKFLLKTTDWSQKEIGQHIIPNMNQAVVCEINLGQIHRDKNESYPIRTETPYHLKDKELNDIKYLLQNSNCKIDDIAEYFGVSRGAISHINYGRNYFDQSLNYPLRQGRAKKDSQPVETILAKRSTLTIDT